MISKLNNIYIKYKEVINYLICGAATTGVNFIVYLTFRQIGVYESISNAISWFAAMMFAYAVNRHYVFVSKAKNIPKEALTFLGARFFSGALDIGLFYLFVSIIRI